MALEPFCPRLNGSWTSRTSVRARCLISRAMRSRVAAVAAKDQQNSACTSRWITWLVASAGRIPSCAHTYSSTLGSIWEYVPTTPDSFPTATTSRARLRRSRSRTSSNAHRASLCPNVVGSACTPWVRPMQRVNSCSNARRRTTPSSVSTRWRIRSIAARSCRASVVSTTSLEVSPKWIHLPASPRGSAIASTNAATSWSVIFSISATRRGGGTTALALICSRSSDGTFPSRVQPSHASSSIRNQWESLASSDHTEAISGSVYLGITTRKDRVDACFSRAESFGQRILEPVDLCPDGRISDRQDLGRQDRRVHRSIDRHRSHRHTPGHLHRRIQGIHAAQRPPGQRDPDHRERGAGGNRSGEMVRQAGPADHTDHPPLLRCSGELIHHVRVAVGGDDPDLVGVADPFQDRRGLLHDGQVGRRADQHADQGRSRHSGDRRSRRLQPSHRIVPVGRFLELVEGAQIIGHPVPSVTGSAMSFL